MTLIYTNSHVTRAYNLRSRVTILVVVCKGKPKDVVPQYVLQYLITAQSLAAVSAHIEADNNLDLIHIQCNLLICVIEFPTRLLDYQIVS